MKTHYDSLILTKSWIPVYLVDWHRAVSLLYQGHAHSLDTDFMSYDWDNWIEYSNKPTFDETYYNYVNSVNLKVAVPDILVLTKFNRLNRREIKFSRENILSRDGHKCAYCGKKFKKEFLTVDHIVPRSRGGKNGWQNCICACKTCNHTKKDLTPQEAGMPLLFQPTEPKWSDSFHKISKNPNIRPNWMKFLSAIGV